MERELLGQQLIGDGLNKHTKQRTHLFASLVLSHVCTVVEPLLQACDAPEGTGDDGATIQAVGRGRVEESGGTTEPRVATFITPFTGAFPRVPSVGLTRELQ